MLLVQYPLLPWFGVLALGYGFAGVYGWSSERRRSVLIWLGAGMALGFAVLRFVNVYGDPAVLPCRWFAGVKARRRDWWLSYL